MSRVFSEIYLKNKLNTLSVSHRAVFAAACSERLFPGYLAFCRKVDRREAGELRKILNDVWDILVEESISFDHIDDKIDLVTELVPGEDEYDWMPELAAAEDASAALAYTLRCLKSGSAQEAAWAARRAYEAVDNYVINIESKSDIVLDIDESIVLMNPIIQLELQRQERDIIDLSNSSVSVNYIRSRAVVEAREFLPWYAAVLDI